MELRGGRYEDDEINQSLAKKNVYIRHLLEKEEHHCTVNDKEIVVTVEADPLWSNLLLSIQQDGETLVDKIRLCTDCEFSNMTINKVKYFVYGGSYEYDNRLGWVDVKGHIRADWKNGYDKEYDFSEFFTMKSNFTLTRKILEQKINNFSKELREKSK